MAQATPEPDDLDQLLERTSLRQALRVCTWLLRFLYNCKNQTKKCCPLVTEEIEEVREWWIRRIQWYDSEAPHYLQVSAYLNFQPNAQGLTVCHGWIQGQYPIYFPNNATFTEKLIQQVHCKTLQGGRRPNNGGSTRTKLRSLVKSVQSKCHGYKRFHATAVTIPAPGQLPEDRTTAGMAFEVLGTDFAGPIKYKQMQKKEGKAHLAIFACSLSKVVLELLSKLEAANFIACLERLITRRGRLRVIYSDKGGTFIKTEKWLSMQ